MFDKFLDSRNWKGIKERRKHYHNSKGFDSTCRNHGSCDWCLENRIYFDKKNRSLADIQLHIPEEDIDMFVHKEKLQKAIDVEHFEEDENYYEAGYWYEQQENQLTEN